MAFSAFNNTLEQPNEVSLGRVLGDSIQLWNRLKNYVEEQWSDIIEEWKHFGKSAGWGLLFKHRRQTLLYLYPTYGYFNVLFVFGEREVELTGQSKLPPELIEKINKAEKFPDGRSFLIEVRTEEDVRNIETLLDIKGAD